MCVAMGIPIGPFGARTELGGREPAVFGFHSHGLGWRG
jgi:hypothetical protein